MTNKRNGWWRYPGWRTFLLVLVGGLLLHGLYPSAWWFSDLIRNGLSEAMMIAAILGLTVDRVAKDRLLREVSADIWAHLMGRDLPLEIKGFIQSAVLDTKLVCTRYESRYRLEERDDGRLNVFVETTRHLQNFGRTAETLEPASWIFLDEEPEFISAGCETEDGQGFSWPTDCNSAQVSTENGTRRLALKTLTFAPYNHKGSQITLTWRHKTVRRTTDTDIAAHHIPSTATTIVLDSAPPWIDFKVDDQPKPVGNIWRINAVLWRNGFRRVRWFDQRPESERGLPIRLPGVGADPSAGEVSSV